MVKVLAFVSLYMSVSAIDLLVFDSLVKLEWVGANK